MSFAFLPLYTGDYLRDTRHLTPLKHGVYLLLLMHCWDQKGPLPLDEQECAGIANCRSADEIESLRYVLERYFVHMEDGWYQGRMQREVERAGSISKARSEAGTKGYQAKAKQLPNKSQARASTPTPTTTTTTTTTESKPLSDSALPKSDDLASSLKLQACEILRFLNAKTGRTYRPGEANLKLIIDRLKEGATVQDCKQVVAKKVRDWKDDPKMQEYLRPKTLFNKTNFAQYLGEIGVQEPQMP